jgi:hypothetical protein
MAKLERKSYFYIPNQTIYCKCGNVIKLDVNCNPIVPNLNNANCQTPVVCNVCEAEYKNQNSLETLGSFKRNIIYSGFKCFESDKFIHLRHSVIKIGKSRTCDKLFTKKFNTLSVIFNKKTKAFYLINRYSGIRRIGLGYIKDKLCNKINDGINFDNKQKEIESLNEISLFVEKISAFVNKKDLVKIEKEYFTLLPEQESVISDLKLSSRKNLFVFKKLQIYTSLILYPPLSTVLFTKGIDFYLKFLTLREIFPSLTLLKKKNPTKPNLIIEELLKCSIKGAMKKGVFKPSYNYGIHYLSVKIKKEDIDKVKITRTLYKNIKEVDVIYFFYKQILYGNLEMLRVFDSFMKKYDQKSVGAIFKQMGNFNNLNLNHKNIEHLIKLYKIECESESILDYSPGVSVHFYSDVIRMLTQLRMNENEILKHKTWSTMVEFHNFLNHRIKIIKQNGYNEKIKENLKEYRKFEMVLDGVEFKLLDSAEALELESQEMSHCVRSYAENIALNKSVIFKITDKETKDRATLEFVKRDMYELNYTQKTIEEKLSFNQLKAKCNIQATLKIINTVIKFCKEVCKAEINDYHLKSGDLNVKKEQPEKSFIELPF